MQCQDIAAYAVRLCKERNVAYNNLYPSSCNLSTTFYPCDALHSVDFAVEMCPSVYPSHTGIVSKCKPVLKLF